MSKTAWEEVRGYFDSKKMNREEREDLKNALMEMDNYAKSLGNHNLINYN